MNANTVDMDRILTLAEWVVEDMETNLWRVAAPSGKEAAQDFANAHEMGLTITYTREDSYEGEKTWWFSVYDESGENVDDYRVMLARSWDAIVAKYAEATR